MSDRQPPEMAEVASETGAKKTHRTWDRVLVSSFLGGAYIAFGALVAITVSSGLDPQTWGTLPTLFMGAAFTLGLVLVLNLAGALFVAFFLAVQTGVIGEAGSEGSELLTYERLAAIAEGKATA